MDNSLIYKCSEFQGRIFELSIKEFKCSSLYFAWRFLISKTITFLDDDLSNFSQNNEEFVLGLALVENKSLNEKGGEKLDSKIMYWVGFMYRFICGYKNITSKYLYSIIKPKKMVELYESLHTQSSEYVADYIIDNFGLKEKEYLKILERIYF